MSRRRGLPHLHMAPWEHSWAWKVEGGVGYWRAGEAQLTGTRASGSPSVVKTGHGARAVERGSRHEQRSKITFSLSLIKRPDLAGDAMPFPMHTARVPLYQPTPIVHVSLVSFQKSIRARFRSLLPVKIVSRELPGLAKRLGWVRRTEGGASRPTSSRRWRRRPVTES